MSLHQCNVQYWRLLSNNIKMLEDKETSILGLIWTYNEKKLCEPTIYKKIYQKNRILTQQETKKWSFFKNAGKLTIKYHKIR